MDVATVAEAAYAGFSRRQSLVIPGLMNRIQSLLPRFLPRSMVPGIVKQAQDRAH